MQTVTRRDLLKTAVGAAALDVVYSPLANSADASGTSGDEPLFSFVIDADDHL